MHNLSRHSSILSSDPSPVIIHLIWVLSSPLEDLSRNDWRVLGIITARSKDQSEIENVLMAGTHSGEELPCRTTNPEVVAVA